MNSSYAPSWDEVIDALKRCVNNNKPGTVMSCFPDTLVLWALHEMCLCVDDVNFEWSFIIDTVSSSIPDHFDRIVGITKLGEYTLGVFCEVSCFNI